MKLFVPGRICLFGEHSDWAGGYRRINSAIKTGCTVIAGTNQGIHAEVRRHPNSLVIRSTGNDGRRLGPWEMPMDKTSLLAEAEKGEFFSYAAGVAYQILTHYQVGGLEIDNYATDLPIQKGLSSSAAICVLTARAFNRIYDLKMTVRGEMEVAYRGEITTPSRCGRMDQGCAFGSRAVVMTYDGDLLECRGMSPRRDMHFVLVDLRASKDTQKILASLNQCYPFAGDKMAEDVQRYLGPINQRITAEAIDAIQAGDARRVGELMDEAQVEFDKHLGPACPDELTAPVLHEVLGDPSIRPHVWGGKGVGSQGDGTAQFTARDAESQQRVVEICRDELGMPAMKLDLRATSRIRKAVIPAAGFGTRLFPATKGTKKELFPIIDSDGIVKPAILAIVEEVLRSDIEEICLVVQAEDKPFFEEFFNTQVPIAVYNRLPQAYQKLADKLLEVGRRVHFAVQEEQEGFGHAVYCARQWVGDEPFLLLLGDHLYLSDSDVPCSQQLLDVYTQHNTSVVGLKRTLEADIVNFGAATGHWREQGTLIEISEFAEKPNVDYARQSLRVEGLPEGEYLTIFGQYVLKPRVFDLLEANIKADVRQRGEFELTSVLDELRREDGFAGYIVQGRRFDIGLPDAYLETLNAFRREGPSSLGRGVVGGGS